MDCQVVLMQFQDQWNQNKPGLAYKQFRNISLLHQRATETLSEMKLFLHCSKISLLSSGFIHC